MLRTLGLFNRNVRELLHTYYQFAAPFVVDDSAFRHAIGGHTTSWNDIVASTVDWYRAHATRPEFVPGRRRAHNPEGDRMMSSRRLALRDRVHAPPNVSRRDVLTFDFESKLYAVPREHLHDRRDRPTPCGIESPSRRPAGWQSVMSSPRETLGLAAVACVACCIGPILGVLGAIAALGLAASILIGAGGLIIAARGHRFIRRHSAAAPDVVRGGVGAGERRAPPDSIVSPVAVGH